MAIKDIRSDLVQNIAYLGTIVAAGVTNGTLIIDTADYELGLMFTCIATAYTEGTINIELMESEAADMSGATVVPGNKIIGATPVVIAAASPQTSAQLPTFGVFSNKRYVRIRATAVGATTSTILVVVTQKGELLPVQPNASAGVLAA